MDLFPLINTKCVEHVSLLKKAPDLDTDKILQDFAKMIKQNNGEIENRTPVKNTCEQKVNVINTLMENINLFHSNTDSTKYSINFIADLNLYFGRIHEIFGVSRTTLALIIAQKMDGHIFWIRTKWNPNNLNTDGISNFINPGRLTFVNVKNLTDILWTMEETLRTNCIPLVVCDLPEIPNFTAVRRLQLTLKSDIYEHKKCLGLLLTPKNGGARGVESRWKATANHSEFQTAWHLECCKAQNTKPGKWKIIKKEGFANYQTIKL